MLKLYAELLQLPEAKRVADRRQRERAGELERIAVITRLPMLLLDLDLAELAEIVDDVLPFKLARMAAGRSASFEPPPRSSTTRSMAWPGELQREHSLRSLSNVCLD